MFLDSERKPEYPGFKPGTPLLWGNSANHHTNMHPQDETKNKKKESDGEIEKRTRDKEETKSLQSRAGAAI